MHSRSRRFGTRLPWAMALLAGILVSGCDDGSEGPSISADGATDVWDPNLDVGGGDSSESDVHSDVGNADTTPQLDIITGQDSQGSDAADGDTAESDVLSDVLSDAIDPDALVRDVAQPDAEVDVVDPDAVDPDAVDPDAIDPDAVDPDAIDPDAVDPDATDPDAIDPDAVDPDAVDPDAVDPDAIDPDAVDPDAVDPDAVDPDAGSGDPCDDLVYPVAFETVSGIGGSEDFAFEPDGNVIINKSGNIVRQGLDGTFEVLAPNFGFTAGISVLPQSGDIMVNAGGELIRVYQDGGSSVILSGLNYPNGMDVDQDDFVYVGEQSGNRLRRVNSDTGEFQIIGEGIPAANGVSFGPGYDRVYVGSFGGGFVHYVDRLEGGKWGPVTLFAKIDGDNTVIGELPDPIEPPDIDYHPCADATEGAACIDVGGYEGACEIDMESGGLTCVKLADAIDPAEAACVGKTEGKGCIVSLWGFVGHGACVSTAYVPECCESKNSTGCQGNACEDCVCGPDAFCCDTQWDNICAEAANNACEEHCHCDGPPGPGGTLTCSAKITADAFCEGLPEGSLCAYVKNADTIWGGRCRNVEDMRSLPGFPTSGVACYPSELITLPDGGGGSGGGGGLDGLNVDECGNVYVTEYTKGYVWRIRPNGSIAPPLKLPAGWIPNMEFGPGAGGYDSDVLYVVDIGAPKMYGLQIGVMGKEVTMPEPGAFSP